MKERLQKYFTKELLGTFLLVCGGILFYFILDRINDVKDAVLWF